MCSFLIISYDDRTSHLNLQTECREIGGNSTSFKGMLSHILNVTIPTGNKINLCHKCHNGKCSNPDHLYYGTSQENKKDYLDNGGKTVWEHMVFKYGYIEACKMNSKGDKSKGGKANKGKPKTAEHRKKISESIKLKHKKNKNSPVAER